MKLALPTVNIGGLAISDYHIRFVQLDDNRVITASVILPPRVVTGGEIKDRVGLAAALRKLRQQLGVKEAHIIAALPVSLVKTKFFTIPAYAHDALAPALGMHMPRQKRAVYRNYQCVLSPAQIYQNVCLAAETDKEIVDEWLKILSKAGFYAAAVDYSAAALARIVGADQNTLVINADDDGINVLAVCEGLPCFQNYASWRELHEEGGGMQLRRHTWLLFLVRAVRKILNEYKHYLGQPLRQYVVVSSSIESAVHQIMRHHFRLHNKIFKNNVVPEFWEAYGAAVRGTIPRSQDPAISLNSKGLERGYYRANILRFIAGWRNIALMVVGLGLIFLIGVNIWFFQTSYSLKKQLAETTPAAVEEAIKLNAQAQEFNRLVALGLQAKADRMIIASALEKINSLGRTAEITFINLSVDSERRAVIKGTAKNEKAVLQFKNLLSKEKSFQDIVLPLSDINNTAEESVLFSVNFKLVP